MNLHSPIETVFQFIQSSHFAGWLFDAGLKSFVVLVLAGGLCLAWRRASAAARHWIWLVAVVSLPCLPLMSLLLPSWPQPLWSVSAGRDSLNQFSLELQFAPAREPLPTASNPLTLPAQSSGAGQSPSGRQHLAAHFSANWLVFAGLAWLGGVVLLLIPPGVGLWRLGRISQQARRLDDSDWMSLLNEAREKLRLRRAVTLLQSTEDVMPLTWGWWRPVVLLPAEAGQWPVNRRRVVLLHELAHVKRWDCLTQFVAAMVRALFWFNPLVWLAVRRMCVERERACDDLVLSGGCKPSDYANQLVEIARTFRRVPGTAGIAMARSSNLEGRVVSIVDAARARRSPRSLVLVWCVAMFGLVVAIAAQKPGATKKPWFDERLRSFFVAKEKQARELAAIEKKEKMAPEVWPYFEAGRNGDWNTVTNLYGAMRKRAYQYEGSQHDESMVTMVWQPINEVYGAWQQFAHWEEKYVLAYGNDIVKSIPPGSIYFGGTDPGRWAITAMSESHVDAKPFFTLSQNPLADSLYEEYVQHMYGSKMNMTTTNEMSQCFEEYIADVGRRDAEHKLKPGENVTRSATGKLQVTGQVAVMNINALIAKRIFDKNPDREFYIEESFPLEWMYPHLEPHGLIMKINRQPQTTLSENSVRRDYDYWTGRLGPMIGDWLHYDTPLTDVVAFVERVHLQQDFKGFKGDRAFLGDSWSQKAFSKERSSIAGVYAWRMEHADSESEKNRMAREADFAFRQAFVLCPYSPEAVFRYIQLLTTRGRIPDAILIAETAARMPLPPGDLNAAGATAQFREAVKSLKAQLPAK